MSRILFRVVTFSVIFVAIGVMNYLVVRSRAGAPAPPAKHGLTGNYYLGNRGWQTDAPPPANGFYQTWSDPNDFMLPRAITTPAATRVDAEVAFGQGKGFHVGPQGPQLVWWPTGFGIPQGWGSSHSPADKPWQANHFAAVVWKGYIHLPKVGTYSFGTVSNGASAVYLNQARVALNGWGGGELVSDAFNYANEQVQDFVTQGSSGKQPSLGDSRFQYAVPVPVDGPRDLPIEVDYDLAKSPSGWGNVALGIDLFWATPDSPRDANGKPTATIVPSDAFYIEAPGPIEKPIVRSSNSTISADYFYVAAKSDNFVTVTVRLADKDGNPAAGKRVSLASVGAQRDEIIQPEKPTNEQGETTGKIRGYQGYSVPHDTTIFAADVTDFVDVAQVGHVMFTNPTNSFFPDSFSPYYDPHAPEVTPEPLQVGRQVTVKMPLVNRNTYAADLEVLFEIHEFNIGVSNWQEIGRVNVRLQPGEHKDVSIQWRPTQATVHICFRVNVNAAKLASAAPPPQALSATLLPVAFEQGGNAPQAYDPNRAALLQPSSELAAALQTASGYSDALSGGQASGGTKQDNKGAVQPPAPPSDCEHYYNGDYGNNNAVLPPVTRQAAQADVNYERLAIEEIKKKLDAGGLPPGERKKLDDQLRNDYGMMTCFEWFAAGNDVQPEQMSKQDIQKLIDEEKQVRDYAEARWWGCTHPPDSPLETCSVDQIMQWQQEVLDDDRRIAALEQLDPADSNYRRLAVAASDSTAAYVEALRISRERYQGAEAAGDQEWMARHFTATRLYEKRIADSLRHDAGEREQKAESLPPDNPQTLASLQANEAQSLEIIRKGGPISSSLRRELLAKGVPEGDLRKLEAPRPDFQLPSELKPTKEASTSFATAERSFADQWQQHSETAPTQEVTRQQSYQLSQTYAVANPHDRQETVDLFIRPISIPADWKLSIVNAEEDQAGQQAGKPGGTPPKYPVHEIDPGKHYNISLPAKAETKVASVVIPVGEVGARTTARWAVEGKIGNELIGGMVHEMNVPYIIPDLQLPPVGSKEVEEELPAPGRHWVRLVVEICAAGVIVGLLMFFFIFWRRRRRTTTGA